MQSLARLSLGWALTTAMVLSGQRARAQDVPVRLTWTAPPGCPSAEIVLSEVRRLLDPEDAGLPSEMDPIEAEVTITLEEDQHRLHLITKRGEEVLGERGDLRERECDPLAEYAATVLAIALNPELVVPEGPTRIAIAAQLTEPTAGADSPVSSETGSELEPPAQGSGAPEPVANAGEPSAPQPDDSEGEEEEDAPEDAPGERPAPAPVEPDGPPPPSGDPALDLTIFAELGTLPTPTAAVSLGGSAPFARRGFIGIAVEGALPRSAGFTEHPDAEASLLWVSARVWSGLRFRSRLVDVSPYASAELGVTGGSTSGVSTPSAGYTVWAALGLGAQLRIWVLKNLALGIDVDARVPLWRPEFIVDFTGMEASAHQASPVVGRAGLTLALHFR